MPRKHMPNESLIDSVAQNLFLALPIFRKRLLHMDVIQRELRTLPGVSPTNSGSMLLPASAVTMPIVPAPSTTTLRPFRSPARLQE